MILLSGVALSALMDYKRNGVNPKDESSTKELTIVRVLVSLDFEFEEAVGGGKHKKGWSLSGGGSLELVGVRKQTSRKAKAFPA